MYKMQQSQVLFIMMIISISIQANGVKFKLIETVKICKRNDPQLNECFCTEFRKLIPMLKDGIAQMNILPLDPIIVENIKVEFPPQQTFWMVVDLHNLFTSGLSATQLSDCQVFITGDGMQLYMKLRIPALHLHSEYRATGHILQFGIDASGEYRGDYGNLVLHHVVNSTLYLKDDKEYMNISSKITNLTIAEIQYRHFTNLFNNTQLNEDINNLINQEVQELYHEIKPILAAVISEIIMRVSNKFFTVFPFDVLFPTM